MATLTVQDISVQGKVDVTFTALTASDDFAFNQDSGKQYLLLENSSGGDITVSLIGDAAPATIVCQGIGTVTVTAESILVTDGTTVSFYLNTISDKLKGTVQLTGGTGLNAAFIKS